MTTPRDPYVDALRQLLAGVTCAKCGSSEIAAKGMKVLGDSMKKLGGETFDVGISVKCLTCEAEWFHEVKQAGVVLGHTDDLKKGRVQ